MPNREGGYGGYQSSQPQQNRMPRKVNAPGTVSYTHLTLPTTSRV